MTVYDIAPLRVYLNVLHKGDLRIVDPLYIESRSATVGWVYSIVKPKSYTAMAVKLAKSLKYKNQIHVLNNDLVLSGVKKFDGW